MDKKEFKFHVNNYRNGTIVFDEQGITYRQNISATAEEVGDIKHCYIPYGSINSIRISLGTPTIRFKIMKNEHIYERSIFFPIKKEDKKVFKTVFEFAKLQVSKSAPTTAIIYDNVEQIKDGTSEIKKRCNVCGNVFCYTLNDLKKNEQLRKTALTNSVASVAGSFSGHYAAGSNSLQNAYNLESQIIDYDKCPSCGSRELFEVTDGEIQQLKKSQNTQHLSSADELKKYKELLDMGVITQEEFEAKKKQLLGL